MVRAAVRETPIRQTAAPAGAKKQRLRKNASQRSMLEIDESILAIVRQDYDSDLQWVTDTVLGEPSARRMEFEMNAWEPVTPDMFGGVFDGMFTRKGHSGEINYQGMVLMYRPYELTQEAVAEQNQARNNQLAAQQNMIKTGQIPGFSPGFEPDHPAAVSKNFLTRTIKPPMDVPHD